MSIVNTAVDKVKKEVRTKAGDTAGLVIAVLAVIGVIALIAAVAVLLYRFMKPDYFDEYDDDVYDDEYEEDKEGEEDEEDSPEEEET